MLATNSMVSFTIPLRLQSEANIHEHWTKSRKRHKLQQNLVYFALLPHLSKIQLPGTVILTRIAPRSLDTDNLPVAFKWIRDQIADMLIPGKAKGQADNDSRIVWHYEQIKRSKTYEINVTYIPNSLNQEYPLSTCILHHQKNIDP